MTNIDFWRTAALGSVALGQSAFVVLYFTFPWWKSFLGRGLFFKAIALAVLVDTYMLFRIFQFAYADIVFTTLYWVLACGVWFQFFAFLRVKLSHRERFVSGNRGNTYE